MQVNIFLLDDGNFYFVVFVDVDHGAVVIMILFSLDLKLSWWKN